MLRTTWWASCLILGGLAVPAFGQVKLEWKLKEGDTFYLENVVESRQTIKESDKTVKQDLNSTTVTRFTVKKKTEEGRWVLEQKIESVKIKSAGGFGAGVDKFADQMKGAVLTLTLDKDGTVYKLEGYDDLVKKVARDDEDAAEMFRLAVSEETYKTAAGLIFGFLPDRPVDKGKTWNKKLTIPLGPLGSLKTDNTYTLKDTTTEGAQIGYTARVDYSIPDKKSDKVPFKIVKGDLSADEAKGTMVFDPEKGRLVRSEETLVLKGKLTLDVSGTEFDVTVEQNTKSKSRLLDKLPDN
jgi:hypothetical protein